MEKRLIFIIVLKISILLHVYPQDISNSTSIDKKQSHVNINSFVYHRFGDERYPSTNVSEEYFESHLRYLKDNDYEVLTLGEAVHLLRSGVNSKPKLVVLTIDDGYKSFLTSGMPLLRKYGFKATMFINTNQVGYPDFLTWEEILSLKKEGIEIGNHSHSHDYFVDFQSGQLIEKFNADLVISQNMFEEKLGYKPELFSYPFGEYSNTMKMELTRFGFIGAVGQNSGVISLLSDIYALPRFPMTGIFSKPEKFVEKLKMKALPVQPVLEYDPIVAENNPPELLLKLVTPDLIQTSGMQCFINGKTDCELNYNSSDSIIRIKCRNYLNSRRTLYTITAPSSENTNVWYWYSWLWIIPGVN